MHDSFSQGLIPKEFLGDDVQKPTECVHDRGEASKLSVFPAHTPPPPTALLKAKSRVCKMGAKENQGMKTV